MQAKSGRKCSNAHSRPKRKNASAANWRRAESCCPWGVEYDEGKWSYKAEAAAKVKRAFRRVLSGEDINYNRIAAELGVTPRGAAMILQNPIWMGWRILDKKRDPSSNGKYPSKDGRQADRKKIRRAESEIIRVQVIDKPLLTTVEWERAQQIMARKKDLHWRNRSEKPRFTYSGFLRCAKCGGPVHSVLAKKDYYVCKASREKPHSCDTRYMPREVLEATLDGLLGDRLTHPQFVARSLAALRREHEKRHGANDAKRLEDAVARLSAKRTRIMDTYFEGLHTVEDRDKRLAAVDRHLSAARGELAEASLHPSAGLTVAELKATLAPLAEWKSWNYFQKRRVLALLAPTIRVVNGRVTHVGLTLGGSVMQTRGGRDSCLPRA